jgi:hypothetical protein
MVYIVSENGCPIGVFWTKTELSEFLGVSRMTILRNLTGDSAVIKGRLVTKLPINDKKRRKFKRFVVFNRR